jgi:hypothetical protein
MRSPNNPHGVLVRIQRWVLQQLETRCDREVLRKLNAIEEFTGRLGT